MVLCFASPPRVSRVLHRWDNVPLAVCRMSPPLSRCRPHSRSSKSSNRQRTLPRVVTIGDLNVCNYLLLGLALREHAVVVHY